MTAKKINIGIVGAGFGSQFYFHKHPNCKVGAVAAQLLEERKILQRTYSCDTIYTSLTEILANKEIDAVALFTPAPYHAAHTIQALKAGKHVLCAVPLGMTIEECKLVKQAVEETGLIYMMAETSVYRQDTISARKFYKEGDFGKMIAAEASYHHPGLEKYFFDHHGQATWRHGLPPMLYSTHCTSFLISVTNERLTSVSCIGWGDEDPVLKNNPFDNPFWNQTALFQTDRKTAFKINISWKGAFMPTERCEWHGEKMSFYSKDPIGLNEVIVRHSSKNGYDDAGFLTNESTVETYHQELWWQTELLPEELRFDSGHFGSHTFITHEFVMSILNNRKPMPDIEHAIAYTLPGIIAHQSSLKNGLQLNIPSYESL